MWPLTGAGEQQRSCSLSPRVAQNAPAARQVEGVHADAGAMEWCGEGCTAGWGMATPRTGAWSRHGSKDEFAEAQRQADKTSNPNWKQSIKHSKCQARECLIGFNNIIHSLRNKHTLLHFAAFEAGRRVRYLLAQDRKTRRAALIPANVWGQIFWDISKVYLTFRGPYKASQSTGKGRLFIKGLLKAQQFLTHPASCQHLMEQNQQSWPDSEIIQKHLALGAHL